MQYTEKNIKYCLLTWDYYENKHVNSYADNNICLSGLYNWSKVFNGKRDFPRTKEDFSKYNLLHVNITPKNLFLIPKLLQKINRNHTKLLFNVDFAIELWNKNFPHTYFFLDTINKADYIFSVEDTMADMLSQTLKREVPCIPHPSPIKEIKKYKTHIRDKRILVSAHRYDMNIVLPWYAIKKAAREEFVTSILGAYANTETALPLYDEVQEYIPDFHDVLKYMAKMYIAVETYMLHSYGRTTIELAALGIPCVGSECVSSMRRCFPDTTIKTNDYNQLVSNISTLIHDKDFYTFVAKEAIDTSEYYSFTNCKKMMLNFLNL